MKKSREFESREIEKMEFEKVVNLKAEKMKKTREFEIYLTENKTMPFEFSSQK